MLRRLIARVFAMRRIPLPLILSSMFGMPNIEEALNGNQQWGLLV
jgi:hypothetical protein